MKAVLAAAAVRTALGADAHAVAARLLRGERAFSALPPGYACRVAARIPGEPAPSRQARFLLRMGAFALEAGRDAMAGVQCAPERLGLYAGMGGLRTQWDALLPALRDQRDDAQGAWERGLSQLHPFWMLQHLSNNAHALLSAELSAQGDGATFGGPTGGAQALTAALRALELGLVDAALVVAYDSLLEPEMLIDLTARGVIGHRSGERPAYDAECGGAVPGEAAAALVLQRGERGVLLSAATRSSDGRDEAQLFARVAGVLGRAQVIDGPGRAWPALDEGTLLCCTSASLGLVGAASAPLQAAIWAELLRAGQAPPIAGLKRVAEGALQPLREAQPARAALCLSGGAPGQAAAVLVEVQP